MLRKQFRVFLKRRTVTHLSVRCISLNMSKHTEHVATLKEKRIKVKEKHGRFSSSVIYLQFLGSGAKGAPRSIFMFSDQTKYLFNCGEGTQRLASEHKAKIGKLEHVFITNSRWENMGGLTGLALTIQDSGVPEITIHGPDGVGELFTATSRFVILNSLEIKTAKCGDGDVFDDHSITMNYVNIKSNVPEDRVDEKPLSDFTEDDIINYYNYAQRNEQPSLSLTRKETKNIRSCSREVTCYICKVKSRAGALDLIACVDKGVPPGPLLGKLKDGIDVTLSDGTVVKSSEVTSPPEIGPVFMVVECPTLDFIEGFTQAEVFTKHQGELEVENDIPRYIIHFTPASIMRDERYQNWMNKFSKKTIHINANDNNECLGNSYPHEVQYKLNLLDEEIFPLLNDNSIPLTDEISEDVLRKEYTFEDYKQKAILNPKIEAYSGVDDEDVLANIEPCENIEADSVGFSSKTLMLRPTNFALNSQRKPLIARSSSIREAMSSPGFPAELEKLKEKIKAKGNSSNYGEYPKVLFLGTGSSIPNKSRNTSCILLSTSATSHIILDCGEGSYCQMVRFFGKDKVDDIMKNVKAIYVSHLHADHHIGLISLLKERHKSMKADHKKVYLLAPVQILTWLFSYNAMYENIMQYFQLLPNHKLNYFNAHLNTDYITEHDAVCTLLGLKEIKTAFVRHCPNSFGIALTHNDGWKITYSGDTMPCEYLKHIGLNSDLLIHEATMEDDLEREAKMKMHSTTSQAIEMGRKMEAKFILLTHFSQRYAKVPKIYDSFTDDIGIAFDNMVVSLKNVGKLPLMFSALKAMFADDCNEIDRKAAKRRLMKTLITDDLDDDEDNNETKRRLY